MFQQCTLPSVEPAEIQEEKRFVSICVSAKKAMQAAERKSLELLIHSQSGDNSVKLGLYVTMIVLDSS